MKKCDFTLRHYEEILKTAQNEGFTFKFFIKPSSNLNQKVIYLRHDIDVSLENALKMAQLEQKLGVVATYFVRVHSSFYNPLHSNALNTLKEISKLGHQFGLHYDGEIQESFSKKQIEKILSREYDFLNNFFSLNRAVSFHRPIPKLLGLNLENFISTYSNYFFNKMEYISDSNRELKRGCILDFIKNHSLNNIQILIHPFWWNEKPLNLKELYKKLLSIKKAQIEKEMKENMKCYKNFKFKT